MKHNWITPLYRICHSIYVLQIRPTSLHKTTRKALQHAIAWFDLEVRYLTFSLKNVMLVSKSTVDLRSARRGLLLAGKLFWRSKGQNEDHRKLEWEAQYDAGEMNTWGEVTNMNNASLIWTHRQCFLISSINLYKSYTC